MDLSPSDPVEAQLVAYNARDIDAFVRCFAPDVVVEDGAGAVVMRGESELRARYGEMFAAHPALHCRVVHRARVGAYVVDEEQVTGRGPAVLHVVVVYRLDAGRIAHVRILR